LALALSNSGEVLPEVGVVMEDPDDWVVVQRTTVVSNCSNTVEMGLDMHPLGVERGMTSMVAVEGADGLVPLKMRHSAHHNHP
jgi:hypothetical protein